MQGTSCILASCTDSNSTPLTIIELNHAAVKTDDNADSFNKDTSSAVKTNSKTATCAGYGPEKRSPPDEETSRQTTAWNTLARGLEKDETM